MKYLDKKAQIEKQAAKNTSMSIYERFQNERDSDILLSSRLAQKQKDLIEKTLNSKKKRQLKCSSKKSSL